MRRLGSSLTGCTLRAARSSLLAAAVLAQASTPALAAPPPVLLRNATVITGKAEPPRVGVDVLVEDGTIREIGLGLTHPSAQVIDAAGKTVMPGIVDCHTHLKSVPGSLLRGDTEAEMAEAQKAQLRAYLAAGVTTVLDAAAPKSVLREMRAYTEQTNLGPRIEGLAPFLTPEGGYLGDADQRRDVYAELPRPIGEDLGAIDREIAEAKALEPVGIKVTVEDGYGPLAVWPVFDDEALAHIKKAAAAQGLLVYAHAIGADEYMHALKLEPYAVVHGGFLEKRPPQSTLEAIKESGATVISTLAITDMMLLVYQHERLDDPWLARLVPERQIATVRDIAMREKLTAAAARQNTPAWVPDIVVRWVTPWFYGEKSIAGFLESALRAVKAMYDAGIPIVMGADMGNWPLLTSLFHAVGSIREMELLEQAGLPREEVIVASTSRAAKLIGRDGEIGTIEPSKRADLVVVNANPLDTGMGALRDLAYVMKGGELRTPEGWME